VQGSLEVWLERRAGLAAGRFILLRTTRAASSDQVGHSLTLSQPSSTNTPHSYILPLYTSYFLLLTVTISLYTMSTNIGPSYLSMVWLQGYNEIKRAKKLIKDTTEIQLSDIRYI